VVPKGGKTLRYAAVQTKEKGALVIIIDAGQPGSFAGFCGISVSGRRV
jgi:hypothetical protein